MRRLIFLAALIFLVAGCVAPAEKPVKDSKLKEHPSPKVDMADWKANHGGYVKSEGEEKCLNCHQPDKFCNKCHSFVGGAPVIEGKAAEAKPAAAEEGAEEKKTEEAAEGQEAVLHGEGTCDGCHEAPALDYIRSGGHKVAFEKFEGHKNFCSNCHDVETDCTKCHSLPAIMQ